MHFENIGQKNVSGLTCLLLVASDGLFWIRWWIPTFHQRRV